MRRQGGLNAYLRAAFTSRSCTASLVGWVAYNSSLHARTVKKPLHNSAGLRLCVGLPPLFWLVSISLRKLPMPVNLSAPVASELLPVAGVRIGVAEAGVRKVNRKDRVFAGRRHQRSWCVHTEPFLRRASAGQPRAFGDRPRHPRDGD